MPSPAVQPCAKDCAATCAELAKVTRLQTEAQMATEVYKPSGQRHVDGWTEVTDPDELAKLDLVPEDLTPADSEFRAAVFRQNGTDNYDVAFKGTTMNSVSDWMANGGQGTTGYSNYYSRAKLIARDVASKVGNGEVDSVKFIGHSLGGGLASAASHATGMPGTTFNAAGLHLLNRSWFNAPPIDAVRVNGEILTTIQSAARGVPFILPEGTGTPYNIDAPSTVGSSLSRMSLGKLDILMPGLIPFKYAKAAIARSVDLHLMSSVNPALKEQRDRLKTKADAGRCGC